MLISVKILKGAECTIEVSAAASITSVKQLVAEQLQIPVDQQRLVFKGKTLLDSESLGDYNIVDGNKLHLFIRGKSQQAPPEFYEQLQNLLEKHFTPADAKKVFDEFVKNLSEQLSSLNLDDIERLAQHHLDSSGGDNSFSQQMHCTQ